MLCRGDCEPPVPANVGKYMRVQAVASLRDVQWRESQGRIPDADDEDFADELNVCCHGRAAAEEVLPLFSAKNAGGLNFCINAQTAA